MAPGKQYAVAAAVLLLCLTGCSRPMVPAARCHLVDAKATDNEVVLSMLDEFAAESGFSASWKDSYGRLFSFTSGGGNTVTVHYRAGITEHGAELTYFGKSDAGDTGLLPAFDRFVADRLATRFSTRKCSDVPGYAPPSSSQ